MATKYPQKVIINEVGPRDGLQNEDQTITLEDKINLVNLLVKSGLKSIEVGSFVSPKWVPQMADSLELIHALELHNNNEVTFSALVPNLKGLASAVKSRIPRIAIFASASETFSKKNINCSIEESLDRFTEVVLEAQQYNLQIRGYVSCAFGCPYEGEFNIKNVVLVSEKLLQLGCYEVAISDTNGVGTPEQTKLIIEELSESLPIEKIAMHMHDTRGRAIENIQIALSYGISSIDASVAGLGGCPYAPGSSGNVATEDVVNLLNDLGIEHGINLQKLISTGNLISKILKRKNSANILRQAKAPFQGLLPIDSDSTDA